MYSKVDEMFWKDDGVMSLSDDAKLAFLYLITNHHRNIIGLYMLPTPYSAYDLKWTDARYEKALGELRTRGMVMRDDRTSVVFVTNYLRHNPLENPNQVKAALKALGQTPRTTLDEQLLIAVLGAEREFMRPLAEALSARTQHALPPPAREAEAKPKQRIDVRAINEAFERMWGVYPNKAGKAAIKDATKRRLYEYGEDAVLACIQRYQKHLLANPWKHALNGSTFFNGRFEDFATDAPVDEPQAERTVAMLEEM